MNEEIDALIRLEKWVEKNCNSCARSACTLPRELHRHITLGEDLHWTSKRDITGSSVPDYKDEIIILPRKCHIKKDRRGRKPRAT